MIYESFTIFILSIWTVWIIFAMMTGIGAIATMVANPTKELHFAHMRLLESGEDVKIPWSQNLIQENNCQNYL